MSCCSQKPLPVLIFRSKLIFIFSFHHFRDRNHSVPHSKMATNKVGISAHQAINWGMCNLTKYFINYLQSLESSEFAGIDLTALFVSIEITLGDKLSFSKYLRISFSKKASKFWGVLYLPSISTAALHVPSAYTMTQFPLCLILSLIYFKSPYCP